MAEIICAVYKIINTITGDFYIGSSNNVKRRWTAHKCPSTWKRYPNNPMYLDMKKYGVDKFVFETLEEVESGRLKEAEQKFIERLNPTYNSNRANGWDVERYKEYEKTDMRKKYQKNYRQSEKGKKSHRKSDKKYNNQLCCYNRETITLEALSMRFKRRGITHSVIEAKKYIIKR